MKIGDVLYKHQGFNGIAKYECTAVIDRKELRLYELSCKSCTHGFYCDVLVKEKEPNVFIFVSMVSNDEYEAWHACTNKGERYFTESWKAKAAAYSEAIDQCDRDISNHQKSIESLEKRKKELTEHRNNAIPSEASK